MPTLAGSTVDLPPPPAHDRQLELARRARDGDRAAFDEMFVSNLRLVLHWARSYQDRGVELDDLVQEGIFGLRTAIEKFNPDAGYRFSTYATWWIRRAMQLAVAAYGRTIRIPREVLEAEAAAERFGEERPFTSRVTASLDASYTESGDSVLSNVIADDAPGTDELAEQRVRDGDLRAAVGRLPGVLPDLVRLRFGLDGAPPMSQSAVAEVLGISQNTLRRLEREAMELLRQDAALAMESS
jgi:RNA polymerase primary sigma factor